MKSVTCSPHITNVRSSTNHQIRKIMFHEYKGPNDLFAATNNTTTTTNNNNNSNNTLLSRGSSTKIATRSQHSGNGQLYNSTTAGQEVTANSTNGGSNPVTVTPSADEESRTTSARSYHQLTNEKPTLKPEIDCEIIAVWMPVPSFTSDAVSDRDLRKSFSFQNIEYSDVHRTDGTFGSRALTAVPSWCSLDCPSRHGSSGQVWSERGLFDGNTRTRNCSDDSQRNHNKELLPTQRDYPYSPGAMATVKSSMSQMPCSQLMIKSESAYSNEFDEPAMEFLTTSTTTWVAPSATDSHASHQPSAGVWCQQGDTVTDAQHYVIGGEPQLQPHESVNLEMGAVYRDCNTIDSQTAALDRLTVLRLRTECRARRLPVSGRKRNLVKRLLPYADVILRYNAVSNAGAPSATLTGALAPVGSLVGDASIVATVVDGPHHVVQSTTAVSATSANVQPPPPIHGSTSVTPVGEFDVQAAIDHVTLENGSDDMIVDVSDTTVHGLPPVTCSTSSASYLDHCNIGRDTSDTRTAGAISSEALHLLACLETANGDGDDAISLPFPLRRSSDGALNDCLVRQQRLIDALRHELYRYRVVLDKAKGSGPLISGLGDDFIGDDAHINLGFHSPVVFEPSYDVKVDANCRQDYGREECVQSPHYEFTTPYGDEADMSSSCFTEADLRSGVVERWASTDKQPPDYYEAVRSLQQRRHSAPEQETVCPSAVTIADVTKALCMTSARFDDVGLFSIDDVIDVLTSSGELPPSVDQRLQQV